MRRRVTENLYVNVVDLVTLIMFAHKAFIEDFLQFVVYDIDITIVLGVVKVKMLEGVHVEVHLVVRAHPMIVDAKHGEL